MNRTRLLFVIMLLPLLTLAAPAQAQERVAVANPARILHQKMEADVNRLQGELKQRRDKIEEFRQQRGAFKPGTQQYDDLNQQLLQASIELDTWTAHMTAEQQRHRKQRTKQMYDKIAAAVAEIAQQRGIDLVIAEQTVQLPDDIEDPRYSFDELRQALGQRNVLFNSGKLDISNDVIVAMDARYKAGQ
jgi:Skp family chaperone for outer membrane proteins